MLRLYSNQYRNHRSNARLLNRSQANQRGLTLLELVIAILILLIPVAMVGSHMFTLARIQVVTADSQRMNLAATELAFQFAEAKAVENQIGQVVVSHEGAVLSVVKGKTEDTPTKPGKQPPSGNYPAGSKIYTYERLVRGTISGVYYLQVRLQGDHEVEVFASTTFYKRG
ncbi:MAG: prepilin-type N-terminal cleavage/methylation domain-containing protein [Acidobacteria bacterium]|nr:prepilin-type N-terminal cleavage/methylation domain-containing protein [Acidobacteriota bacterium]